MHNGVTAILFCAITLSIWKVNYDVQKISCVWKIIIYLMVERLSVGLYRTLIPCTTFAMQCLPMAYLCRFVDHTSQTKIICEIKIITNYVITT